LNQQVKIKKQRTKKSILEEYEDTSENESDASDNIGHEIFIHKSSKPNELTKYLDMYINKTALSQNSLELDMHQIQHWF
jgi:hypothetical protein